MTNTIEIDGSYGEGGGQILRSSLTMAILTGQPFHITKIRAGREKPGLSHQHLEAIEAAAQISGSRLQGNKLHSQELTFVPGQVVGGDYVFEVGTAGAMTLVLQTVILPLALSGKSCRVEFKGGTHVPWSPPYEYLSRVWGSVVGKLGLRVRWEILKAGYYPKGGGHFIAHIEPSSSLSPLQMTERPSLRAIRLVVVLSHLNQSVAEREVATAQAGLAALGLADKVSTEILQFHSPGPGNLFMIQVEMDGWSAGFSSIGAKGKPAEAVAQEALTEFVQFWNQTAPVEKHLADQLLLPLTFASGNSAYRVDSVSLHLLSNAYIIQHFHPVKIAIQGAEGQPGLVTVSSVV